MVTRFSSLFAVLLLVSIPSSLFAQLGKSDVWIGTGGGKGIYYTQLNANNGRLDTPVLAAEISRPGFLAMHPNGKVLYSIGALEGTAVAAAYAIERDKGKSTLRLLNSQDTGDGGSAHIAVDSAGRLLITAQYGGGSVSAYKLAKDGSIAERTQVIEHEGGSNVNPRRQSAPHPHWTGFSPDDRFAFVPDLGLDKVVIYRVDADAAKLTPHGSADLPPGGGPRHMKFHKNGKWVYVLNELTLSVTVFDYDAEAGKMTAKQTIPTVPKEQLLKEKFKSCSEIRVHRNGQFVYAANRGHDTITAFRVNAETGELSVIEREFVRGATPRNFNLSPSGSWLLAGGQDSNTLASFQVDSSTGELSYNRSVVNAPSPICVLFQHE